MPQFTENDVSSWFSKFGLEASPEELTAFAGLDYVGGGNAIADYVLTKKNLAEQQANDPLKKVIEAEQTFSSAQQAAAQGYGADADKLFGQLQDIMGQAPKLFGNLSPEQIDQYLAPLKTTFTAADATAQSGAAARGLGGSSIEAQTRADAANKFKENVLSTGLTVGMNQQQTSEQILQQEIARKSGLMMGSNQLALSGLNAAGGAASQLSSQGNSNALLMSSLPAYLQAQNLQQLIAQNAYKKSQGGGLISTLGDINTGINTFKNILSIPSSLGGYNYQTGSTPSFPQGSPSMSPSFSPTSASAMNSAGSSLLPSSLSLTQSAPLLAGA